MPDSIRFEFDDREVKDLIRDLVRQGNKEVSSGVKDSAEKGKDLMRDILNQQGSGEEYLSAQSETRTYQASAPGEPPATDTGTYRDSWDVEIGEFKAELFTPDKRGPWLEYGTEHMESRPHIMPWFRKHKPVHESSILAALKEAVRKSKQ